MKTILIAASSLLFFTASLKAQNEAIYASTNDKESKTEKRELKKAERKTEVSYQSKQEFIRNFDNPKDVSWAVSKNFEEARFTNNGVQMTAYYDAESELVGTTTLKNFSDLPARAQEYIKNHYKGYNIETVLLFDDNESNDTNMILYDTEFEDADNYFVELKNNNESIIVKSDTLGNVSYFKKI